jgi:hypothetical protein
LRARIERIRRRLAVPVGGRCGRSRGYESAGERYQKQRRLQVLQCRLVRVEARLDDGRVSICRGGRRLARARHHLDEVGITAVQWQQRWQASRLFICADGEADKRWGNETIRFHPDKGWVEIKLPGPLADLANRPHGRWRLTTPVAFAHRGDEVAAQAATGAVRYDICYEPNRQRWYLDASWKTPTTTSPSVDELGEHPVLAVDMNAGHLAAVVVDSCGNPMGVPVTISLDLAGLSTPTRDGRLRAAVSSLLGLAGTHGCRAVVIEDLDFAAAREQGRERTSRRPSRGRRGRSFRRLVAGIPTAQFRDRLVQMTANRGLWVVAVDPAYTSQWGAEHWLGALRQLSPEASGHHAAALVIGRRGLRQRARRRERCDSTRPEDRQEGATNSAVRAMPAPTGLSEQHSRKPGNRKARGQPYPRRKTRPADRSPPGDQATQDRSGPPTSGTQFRSVSRNGPRAVAADGHHHPVRPGPDLGGVAGPARVRRVGRRVGAGPADHQPPRVGVAAAGLPGHRAVAEPVGDGGGGGRDRRGPRTGRGGAGRQAEHGQGGGQQAGGTRHWFRGRRMLQGTPDPGAGV